MMSNNSNKPNVLVADVPSGQARVGEGLSSDYNVSFASDMQEARRLLKQNSFELVIIGLHFNESRCFELISYLRTSKKLRNVPFLIIQERPSIFDGSDTSQHCAHLLGACNVIKTYDSTVEEANRMVRKAVEECLSQQNTKSAAN